MSVLGLINLAGHYEVDIENKFHKGFWNFEKAF